MIYPECWPYALDGRGRVVLLGGVDAGVALVRGLLVAGLVVRAGLGGQRHVLDGDALVDLDRELGWVVASGFNLERGFICVIYLLRFTCGENAS